MTPYLRRLILSLAAFVLLSYPAQARWLKAETPQFIVYSDGKEEELRDFASQLEEYDALLRFFTGLTAPPSQTKLTVYLVRSGGQLRTVHPKAGATVAGFYRASPGGTIAVALRTEQLGLSADLILQHEYAHHFMLHYYPAYYPAWYVEGFAEYFGATEFTEDRMNVGVGSANRAAALLYGTWKPMRKILTEPDASKLDTFYAQSWLVVHYFMSTDQGRKQLTALMKALAEGAPAEEAFTKITGMDFRAFDNVMRKYLSAKLRGWGLKRDNKGKVDIRVTALSPAADDLLLVNARLWHTPAGKDAAEVAEEVRKKAAAFPNDELALRAQAMAELDAREYDKADETIARLEAVTPGDVNVPFLRTMRYYGEGREKKDQRTELWAQARKHAVAAYKIDANHYPTLYMYAAMALDKPGVPDENILNAIVRAHELGPAVAAIRLEAAVALARAGRHKEAQMLLIPVVFNAHGRMQGFVTELYEKISAGAPITQPLSELYPIDAKEDEDDK